MEQITVKFTKLDERAQVPAYGTQYAAGADLRAVLDAPVTILPGQTLLMHTGIAMEIPEGFVGLVYARSGLAAKRGLAPANKVGVIDSDYRGEFIVALHNHGDSAQTILPGDRIAQLLIVPVLTPPYELCDDLSDTQRAAGGFGSTGQ